MRTRSFVAAVLMFVACDSDRGQFRLPTTPTPIGATNPPAPQPAPLPPRPTLDPHVEVTSIAIGDVVARTIGSTVPECSGDPGWPCQYFSVTPERDGIVNVDLEYEPETQPPGRTIYQLVDVSVAAGTSEVWANSSTYHSTHATVRVVAQVEYRITLWYTFPGLKYTLRTTYAD